MHTAEGSIFITYPLGRVMWLNQKNVHSGEKKRNKIKSPNAIIHCWFGGWDNQLREKKGWLAHLGSSVRDWWATECLACGGAVRHSESWRLSKQLLGRETRNRKGKEGRRKEAGRGIREEKGGERKRERESSIPQGHAPNDLKPPCPTS